MVLERRTRGVPRFNWVEVYKETGLRMSKDRYGQAALGYQSVPHGKDKTISELSVELDLDLTRKVAPVMSDEKDLGE